MCLFVPSPGAFPRTVTSSFEAMGNSVHVHSESSSACHRAPQLSLLASLLVAVAGTSLLHLALCIYVDIAQTMSLKVNRSWRGA